MKVRAVVAVFIAVAFIVSCSCAFAQYVPEIVSVKGDPKIMKKGAEAPMSCAEKMAVSNGDRITTAKDESVTVGFVQNVKNIVRIGGESEAVIVSGQEPTYTIDLLRGEAMTLVLSLPEDCTFQIRTPAGVSFASGTGWRSLTDGEISTFEAYNNTIYVKGVYADGGVMDNETFVDMGYRTVVKKLGQPEPVQRLAPEDIDRWNAWRDEVENREAKSTEVSDRPSDSPAQQ